MAFYHPLASQSLTCRSNGYSTIDSGDPMETTETVAYETPGNVPPHPLSVVSVPPTKGKKRKRAAKPSRESMMELDSSDVEPSEDYDLAEQAPPPPLVSPSFEPDPGDADFFRPSVVTLVPGLSAQMKQAARQSYRAASEGSSSGSAYEGKKLKKKPGGKGGSKPKQKSSGGESDRPTRKRTKTGCWSCRSRKMKCDESRPTCSQCARSRPPRDCSFPEDPNDSTPSGMPYT
jgi:hypothetical protein